MKKRILPLHPSMADREPLQDHCGILAAFAPKDIHFFTNGLSGLKKLQTRGYDGAGIGAIDTLGAASIYKNEGLVEDVFKPRVVKRLEKIEARMWVLQVRYGTVGKFSRRNVQPFLRYHRKTKEPFIVVHNGQFSVENGEGYKIGSDTLYFVRQLGKSEEPTWDERIKNLLDNKRGAWSIALATRDALYLARDPMGIRPLSYGFLTGKEGEKTWVAASETSALHEIGISQFYEVLPGELVKITAEGPTRIERITPKLGLCIFENVYLMKGEGKAHLPRGRSEEINASPTVDHVRAASGVYLAKEAPLTAKTDVDFAVGIPGTGITGGEAYAKALGIPYFQAITDRVPQGDQRTFMQAEIDQIYRSVLRHFNFDEKRFAGKRVVLIDDSIVRGNVTRGLIDLLKKKYHAASVHIRVLCPPIDKICYLGINTRRASELLADQAQDKLGERVDLKLIVAAMAHELGADSLAYLSDRGLKAATTGDPNDNRFCLGCMFGNVPPITRRGKYLKKS